MRARGDLDERLVLEPVLGELGGLGVDVDAVAVGAHRRGASVVARSRALEPCSRVPPAHRRLQRRVEVDVLALVAGRVGVRDVGRERGCWRSAAPRDGALEGELGGVEQFHSGWGFLGGGGRPWTVPSTRPWVLGGSSAVAGIP